ncbi:major facilitator superfamily domain-containing protein 10-like isoform X2 [Scylla paramamosain]|uniref:major facilitator superfamily domain-containing protein 10-like isoform X2 n=1 Tax=Scylla paramamosain TaxID=85552 RepID=UPI0030833BB7
MATLRSGKQVGGSDGSGGGGGSGGEVDSRDRGAVQAADIKKKNARTSKVVFGSLILDLLGFTVLLPLFPAVLDYYSKHDSSGLYSSLLSSVTYYQHIISIPTTPSPAFCPAPPRHHGPAATPFHLLHDAG